MSLSAHRRYSFVHLNIFIECLVRRCNEGYDGAYCQVSATTTTSNLPLLVSLLILLPVAAILVLVVVMIAICRALRRGQDVRDSVRPRCGRSR